MSDPDIQTKIAEFTAVCVGLIPPPEAAFVDITQPITEAHRRIFGCNPSGATIVRIVGRNLLLEAGDGMFVHAAVEFPDYLLKTISLCGVQTKIVKGHKIPNWNGPSDKAIHVCMF